MRRSARQQRPVGRRGVTSILSLVAVMLFTMLLVMLTNVVRHADDKVRMQNAVDAATYSGAAVLARGMNSIAFANHLQSETLALTALLRALDDRGSQTARQLLPVMRAVLGTPETDSPVAGDHLLPNYQREVIALFPAMAQTATHEIAMRHGLPQGRLPAGLSQARTAPPSQFGSRGPQPGMLWQSRGAAVGTVDEADPQGRTLPVVDPGLDGGDALRFPDLGGLQSRARLKRLEIATRALRRLYDDLPPARRRDASLLGDANRYLNRLLEVEYPNSNLPMQLRSDGGGSWQDHSVLGTVHRAFDREHGPKLFVNPLAARGDAVTFAQAEFFLARPRYRCCPWTVETPAGAANNTDPWPREWDASNQTWGARLVPADETSVLQVLQSRGATAMRIPALEGLAPMDVERINTH